MDDGQFLTAKQIQELQKELQENLLNDTERFLSKEEHQCAIEVLSKDLDTVKQSIFDDSKIIKKGVIDISIKIYSENE